MRSLAVIVGLFFLICAGAVTPKIPWGASSDKLIGYLVGVGGIGFVGLAVIVWGMRSPKQYVPTDEELIGQVDWSATRRLPLSPAQYAAQYAPAVAVPSRGVRSPGGQLFCGLLMTTLAVGTWFKYGDEIRAEMRPPVTITTDQVGKATKASDLPPVFKVSAARAVETNVVIESSKHGVVSRYVLLPAGNRWAVVLLSKSATLGTLTATASEWRTGGNNDDLLGRLRSKFPTHQLHSLVLDAETDHGMQPYAKIAAMVVFLLAGLWCALQGFIGLAARSVEPAETWAP